MADMQSAPSDNSREWREDRIRIGEAELSVVQGGAGKPLLILHEELGYPGWLRWQSALARERSLLIPMHPGFGRTARLEWITSVRDLAAFYGRMLRQQNLTPIDVIGFSLGGWIAAEMAVDNPAQFRRMILVAPAGVRPPQGEIFDLYNVTVNAYLRTSVHDCAATAEFDRLFADMAPLEQMEVWEDARIQTARVAWRPYMYNPSLPHLLEGVSALPTALIWGGEDRVVPLSAARTYQNAIEGAQLAVIAGAGHRPEIEKSDQFVRLVREFLV
jgi:pimeloyl-ACP methyl ester carboxylesterase